MKLWLTGRQDGKFMMTYLEPIIERVKGTRNLDAYEAYGEPTGVMHLCGPGTKALFGSVPEPLKPVRIEIAARYL